LFEGLFCRFLAHGVYDPDSVVPENLLVAFVLGLDDSENLLVVLVLGLDDPDSVVPENLLVAFVLGVFHHRIFGINRL
tara:strand:- start:153 stop:386 length:234 start_codon:yes stop_codon:yes gene_type:complete